MNTKYPLLAVIRHARYFVNSIAYLCIFAFVGTFYSPAVFASYRAKDMGIYDGSAQAEKRFFRELSAKNSYIQQAISGLDRELTKADSDKARIDAINRYLAKQSRALTSEWLPELNQRLAERVAAPQNGEAMPEHLKVQQQRIEQVVAKGHQFANQLSTFSELDVGEQKAQLPAMLALVNEVNRQAPVHGYDNDNLPFGPRPNMQPKAALNIDDLRAKLGLSAPKQAKSKVMSKSISGAVVDNQSFVPLDLNATIDAPITDAIVQKAAELNHDPVAIYNYVYNNIRFVPSYGSIQGADYTLLSQQGNAFDTASLLIALYRASGIPARYGYGTVEFDKAPLMNWVGGVDVWEAAQNLLGQGGIPVTIINENGEFRSVGIEHSWVEAWIGDKWQAVDPSFKQYQFTERLKLEDEVPVNVDQLQNIIENSAVVNEDEGWVQGIDQIALQTEMEAYRTQLQDYLETNHADATVGDVLGTTTIVTTDAQQLPTTLPYKGILVRESFSTIPDSLRLQYSFKLMSEFDSTIFTFTKSGPEVVGKRHALSFSPATPEDEQRLADTIPDDIQNVSDLPDSLPVNFINLVAEWVVDGETQITSGAMGLGAELKLQQGFYEPGLGWTWGETSPANAGSYHAVGIDLQGIAPGQLESLKTDLEDAKTKLEAQQFDGLSKHDIVGNMMQAGVMTYFGITAAQDRIAAQMADTQYYRQPSFGTFSIGASIGYVFGMPSDIRFTGVVMDIDRLTSLTETNNNCWNDWANFNSQSGSRSSLFENIVPEQLFGQEDANGNKPEGVSAVKAISVAAAQGQKIYTLTSANKASLSQINIDVQAGNEIRDALNQGKTVTVHQSPIDYHGWSGSGYIIADNDTGTGAYKISGGSNGGDMPTDWAAAAGTGGMGGGGGGGSGGNDTVLELLNNLFGAINSLIDIFEFIDECWDSEQFWTFLIVSIVVWFVLLIISVILAALLVRTILQLASIWHVFRHPVAFQRALAAVGLLPWPSGAGEATEHCRGRP